MIEGHPDNYKGYPFVSLIVLAKMSKLVIVDNANNKTIRTYVIDLCGPAKVDEGQFIELTQDWYDNHRHIPISVYFSKNGLSANMFPILKEFTVADVQRIIGPVFTYNMENLGKVRRRRRKEMTVVDKDNIVYTNVFENKRL